VATKGKPVLPSSFGLLRGGGEGGKGKREKTFANSRGEGGKGKIIPVTRLTRGIKMVLPRWITGGGGGGWVGSLAKGGGSRWGRGRMQFTRKRGGKIFTTKGASGGGKEGTHLIQEGGSL